MLYSKTQKFSKYLSFIKTPKSSAYTQVPMIFLINKVDSEHQVIVHENITDLTQRVEWQDIFEGKSIIIDKNGIEYEWDSSQKTEIGTVYNYTLIPTLRVSKLITECLKRIELNKDICEFSF